MRYFTTACLSILFILVAFRSPSSFTVTGKITDDKGLPIPSVVIVIKGTQTGTTSGMDGSFQITVNSEKATLVFSTIGFQQKEVAVSSKTTLLNVSLTADSKSLSEVVVTAYGIRRKSGTLYKAPKKTYNKNQYSQSAPIADGVSHGLAGNDDREFGREGYDAIVENRFVQANNTPLSTFSIDVDAASYSNIRRMLNMGQLPPTGAVRTEELINYFKYDYPQPANEDPFSVNTEIADCPWNKEHKLVMIGLQGKIIPTDNLPASNLVFLVDVSGSMSAENKLPLVQKSLKLLVDQLRPQDKVALIVYAGNAGTVLPATSGNEKAKIKQAIDHLEAGGSTAGGEGIKLAYEIARESFMENGNNRVILCTDGDFNVGISSDSDLEDLIEEERESGIFLTVLGYGMGNYQDAKMQKLADKGNGNHAYIDNFNEARKVLVNEFGGTLFTIAKDVKLQIEFNPSKVQAYRLIGYENRLLNKEDFNNDKKDAGDMGSGHTVTAFYEVIPVGVKSEFIESVDKLKYQSETKNVKTDSKELLTIKLRYKNPDQLKSKLIEHPVLDNKADITQTSNNFRFAAAIAEFGMLLRKSEFKQSSSFESVFELAKNAIGEDKEGYRAEFIQLLKTAQSLVKTDAGSEKDKLSKK